MDVCITSNISFMKEKIKADYHAVPHAVFSDPEIAGVGMGEQEAEQVGARQVVVLDPLPASVDCAKVQGE